MTRVVDATHNLFLNSMKSMKDLKLLLLYIRLLNHST